MRFTVLDLQQTYITKPACKTNIQRRIEQSLHSRLGLDLAGYFSVEASQHQHDRATRVEIQYKGNVVAVGVGKDTDSVCENIIKENLAPALKELRSDIDKILKQLGIKHG